VSTTKRPSDISHGRGQIVPSIAIASPAGEPVHDDFTIDGILIRQTREPTRTYRGQKTDINMEDGMVDLLERFCSGFAAGDANAVMATCDMTDELTVVTSEQLVLRGANEFAEFLDRYIRGPTRYAWTWDRLDVATHDNVAWLLATGYPTANTAGVTVSHPYMMTMVGTRRLGRWTLVQAHGSCPQA
jgi:ketosteroid isomerase-like protein